MSEQLPLGDRPQLVDRRFFLVADVGGTHARFALAGTGGLSHYRVLACADHPGIDDAMRAYVASIDAPPVRHAAIAIATPVDGDAIRMTNHAWAFSIEELRATLSLETLRVMNDFAAIAHALPALTPADLEPIGGGTQQPLEPRCVLGPGTGLGVAAMVHAGGQWTVVPSEGGHASFSPSDEVEAEILRFTWTEHPHVSSERLVSGPGLTLIHRALCAVRGKKVEKLGADEIVRRAATPEGALCAETLSRFSAMLGTFAANMAVTLGARGGIYIAGGVVGKLGEHFDRERFRTRFEAKGRFGGYLAAIPTWRITHECPALAGLATLPPGCDRL
ncbi:glucokinase [Usitatibacter palustris]|uniref:Glucokinase n=1 Tax=Usitatibacter palustris TaxID=2732487 RepID=A0A6M4H3A6_9PROT|nr:glucokinase [Usitatibacter palustris]QJR14059.1 Glucokinase [Usitatibacter palustris]